MSPVVSVAFSVPTFTVSPWWMVKRQAQWDDGSDFQDDEGDVLQSFPHQLQERLGLLGGNEVPAKCIVTVLQVKGVPRQTCTHGQRNSLSFRFEKGWAFRCFLPYLRKTTKKTQPLGELRSPCAEMVDGFPLKSFSHLIFSCTELCSHCPWDDFFF